MADFPLAGASKFFNIGFQSGTTTLKDLATTGSTNTKAAWTEISASTAYAMQGFWVQLYAASGAASNALIDIGIGAAGSEIVVVPNLMWKRSASSSSAPLTAYMPISIPAGTRVAARSQGSNATTTVSLGMICKVATSQSANGYAKGVNHGAVTADSTGTTLTAGTANTKGSYVELVASTAERCNGLLVCVMPNATGTVHSVDIAVGAAASEVIVIPDFFSRCVGNTTEEGGNYAFIDISIPAGTRISARTQSSTASATCELVLIGV